MVLAVSQSVELNACIVNFCLRRFNAFERVSIVVTWATLILSVVFILALSLVLIYSCRQKCTDDDRSFQVI